MRWLDWWRRFHPDDFPLRTHAELEDVKLGDRVLDRDMRSATGERVGMRGQGEFDDETE